MAHTPGPWHVGPHYKHDVESREGRVAECVPVGSPRAAENAQLIAAAPTMLEALRFAAQYMDDAEAGYGESDLHEPSEITRERVRAAIAAAEGR